MKRLFFSMAVSLALAPFATVTAAPVPGYTNYSTVNTPQVDAITVVNFGTFNATTTLPYETADTLNFFNYGSMNGSIGWLFDDSPSGSGVRQWSANFYNASSIHGVNFLLVQSTNIFSSGDLSVDSLGLINLTGDDVMLAQSILDVSSITPAGSQFPVMTNRFIPDSAVYDLYWAQTNFDQNYRLLSGSIWNGTTAQAQAVPSPPAGPGPIAGFSLPNNLIADSYITILATATVTTTNAAGMPAAMLTIVTNQNRGAVFVIGPPSFRVLTKFTLGQNGFSNINVQFAAPLTNVYNKIVTTNYVYFQDTLASYGSLGLLLNASTLSTYRPSNYNVERFPHDDLFITNVSITLSNNVFVTNYIPPLGFSGQGKPTNNFFTVSGNVNPLITLDLVTNTVVQSGAFAAYSPFLDNVASRPPPVAGGTITNLPGSIQIMAKNLDLTQARLRAEGEISIQAENLISSAGASIDCENLSFNLGSARGNLVVTNLNSVGVGRLRGILRAWSAFWTNTVNVVVSNNYAIDTSSGMTNWVLTPLTNAVNVQYDVLVLDGSQLLNTLTVSLYDLNMHGIHIELDDDMIVLQSLLVDGNSFTINGSLTLPGFFPPANPINNVVFPGTALQNWTAANAPTLNFFTNNGTLIIPNEAHFGDDRPPYSTFVNKGLLEAGSVSVDSAYVENSGTLFAFTGPLSVHSDRSLLHDGVSASSQSFNQFSGGSVVFSNYQVFAGDALLFNVTGNLSDAGAASGNLFQTGNGFRLLTKPQTGDLLGTTILSTAPRSQVQTVFSTWAGEDRGTNPAGYINNTAVGTLALSAVNPLSTFAFSATSPIPGNALYVDVLDLTALGSNSVSVLSQLQINPGMVIYYAAALTGFTPPLTNGVAQQPAEYLNGKLNGRLRWVSSYAGPNSSANVVIGGHNVTINSALANSQVTTGLQVAPLTLTINGNGTVQPVTNGQYLVLNQNYALVAQPAPGSAFLGWTGSISTASSQVTFLMQSNINLVASFTFSPTVGTFSGLFYPTSGVAMGRSGFISFSETKSGKYTGSLQIGTKHISFTGQLDGNGSNTLAIPNSGLTLKLLAGTDRVIGSVSSNTAWTAPFIADRAVWNSQNKPGFAGKYTIVFRGSNNSTDTNNPQGDGIGTVNVSSAGKVQFSGTLPDGTKVSQAATASGDGAWPLYVPLYKGQGQLLSWQTFVSTSDSDVGGSFSWIKLPKPGDKFYPAGFNFQTNAAGSKYDSTLSPVTGFSAAGLLLSGGNLTLDVANTVSISSKNKITTETGGKLTMSLTPASGLFKGNATDLVTGKPVAFNGVILQKQSAGFGYFLGTNLSGHVSFHP